MAQRAPQSIEKFIDNKFEYGFQYEYFESGNLSRVRCRCLFALVFRPTATPRPARVGLLFSLILHLRTRQVVTTKRNIGVIEEYFEDDEQATAPSEQQWHASRFVALVPIWSLQTDLALDQLARSSLDDGELIGDVDT